MTVGAIQFDAMFSGADALCVADTSGLKPLSFNPPSSDALGRFLLSMSDDKSAVDSIRLALESIAQNMSSPHEAPVAKSQVGETLVVKKPVIAPATRHAKIAEEPSDPRSATIAEPPVAKVPVAKSQVGETLVVEKPVVEAPLAATAAPVVESPATPVAKAIVVESSVASVANGARCASCRDCCS